MNSQPLLTWDEICQEYPNAWVMVGYHEEEAKKRDWEQSIYRPSLNSIELKLVATALPPQKFELFIQNIGKGHCLDCFEVQHSIKGFPMRERRQVLPM